MSEETNALVKKLRSGVIGIEDSLDGWLIDGPATENLIFAAADLLTSQASEIARLREALEVFARINPEGKLATYARAALSERKTT